jgi:S-DNA-T family DNA segregation ATPase FtsK/SpoIIIE
VDEDMSIAVAGRIEVRLTYVPLEGPARDLLVRASTASTIEDLADAIVAVVGRAPARALFNDRSGALAAGRRLGDGVLRDGDVIREGGTDGAFDGRVGSGLEACVVGGPRSGSRFPLAPGASIVGRDPDADVPIQDPSLSRRHARIVVTAAGASIADEGSSNGTAVDGRRLESGETRALGPEDHVEVGRSLLVVRPVTRADNTVVRSRDAQVEFNRMPRMARDAEPAVVDLAPPPARGGGPRLPLAASAGPLVLGVAMFAITKQPTMLLFSLLSPVMAVSTFVSDRRGGRKAYASQLAAFHAAAGRVTDEVPRMRAAEVTARRAEAPDPAAIAARAVRHLPELWERRRDDEDFLWLRLGTADQPAAFTVAFGEGGEASEREPVERLVAEQRALASVPLCARLADAGGIGLSGEPVQAEALARWLLAQAAVLHSPRELVVCAALSEERAADWRWLSWLPHAAPTRAIVDHANLAVGDRAANDLLAAVSTVAALRRDSHRDRFSARRRPPTVLLLIDEDVAPSRAIVDDLLGDAGETDVAIVWLGRRRRELPGGCGVVVELDPNKAAMDVSWPRDGRELRDATPDGIDLAVADEIARALAPVRDVTQSRSGATLPRAVPLLEMLDAADLDAAAVLRHWEDAREGALEAPVGVGPDGVVRIDLRRDGPHALVAGTTGAGKSELLQTLVAGMALSVSPTRVSFLFVDYKGGAAFKDCVHLPHTVGMVTDLDEHLTQRALVSLNAELRAREHLLKEADVRDLAELERQAPDQAPPSLVIVIDEFAALKTEVPEFVDGVVDIAQRGRSLGVHLILATQRPGGVVSDNIRANTNLRMALRVQDRGDSEDVIGDPAAARISKSLPGRAYARTGHSELTELQSAYAGARTPVPEAGAEVAVTELLLGEPVAVERAADDAGPTDLERVVAAARAAAQVAGLAQAPSPWLPPLGEVVSVDELDDDAASGTVPLGLVDEPRRQRRRTWGIDLEQDGSAFVFGASGSGKTTVLRTLAVQLARRAEPRHLQLYGLDFAGYGLAALEALPHCGAVISGEDEERVSRLLERLRVEIAERSRRFADHGVATLSEFQAITDPDRWPARIVVLLDSYAGFTTAFEGVDLGVLTQRLPRIIADGRAAGVHVVATAERRNAIPHSVAALVSRRIVLRLADEDEYVPLGLERKVVKGAVLPPGRGFVEDTLEIQIAVAAAAAAGDGAVAAIAEEGARLARLHGDDHAPGIPTMPAAVGAAAMPPAADAAHPVLGLEEAQLEPVAIDLAESAFFVCGPYRSGRTTALATLVGSIHAADPGVELHLLAPRRTALTAIDGVFAGVARGADACQEAAQRLVDLVLQRSPEEEHPLLVVVIDDVGELTDGLAGTSIETLARRGRDVNVRIVASCETGQARGFAGALKELRKDGRGLLLQPSLDMDGDVLGVRLPRRATLELPPGRGFLIGGPAPVLVQVAAGGA